MKFTSQNNNTTLSNIKHTINSTNRIYMVLIFMLNHFPNEIIVYYNYFSKGHNVGATFVHPFPALWQTLTLLPMEKNLRTEQSVPIDTMLKAHIIIMTKFPIK